MSQAYAIRFGHESQVIGVGIERPGAGLFDDVFILVCIEERLVTQCALVRLVDYV